MQTDPANLPDSTDEATVERAVRDILFPLDQRLEVTTNWGCTIAAFVALPLLLGILYGGTVNGWLAGLIAVGVPFATWTVVGAWLDSRLASQAREAFNTRFPAGDPARPLAIRMLSEMECPNKAQDKLKVALNRSIANKES